MEKRYVKIGNREILVGLDFYADADAVVANVQVGGAVVAMAWKEPADLDFILEYLDDIMEIFMDGLEKEKGSGA